MGCLAVESPGLSALRRPLQDSDDSQSLRRKPSQRGDDFAALRRRSLAEGYLKSDLSVILDLTFKGNASAVGIGRDEHNLVSRDLPVFVLNFHALDARDREHWDQEMVFVVNVESVEGQEYRRPLPRNISRD